MRLPPLTAWVAAALGFVSAPLRAQSASDISPRAGAWGAEVSTGALYSASLLHFSSADAAWLVGVTFDVARETRDVPSFGGSTTTETSTTASLAGRLGRRWWSGDRTSRMRPLLGLGVTGGLSDGARQRSWGAGTYGELGATYFFSPHVSLGASAELDLNYYHSRSPTGIPGSPEFLIRRWDLRGNLARLAAAVYF